MPELPRVYTLRNVGMNGESRYEMIERGTVIARVWREGREWTFVIDGISRGPYPTLKAATRAAESELHVEGGH